MIAAVLSLALASAAPPAAVQVEPEAKIVDLNTATTDELSQLPGIGPKKAAAIVARREQHPFTRVTQLLDVRGIGKKTLERLKPFVRVAPPPLTPRKPAPRGAPVVDARASPPQDAAHAGVGAAGP